MKTPAVKKLILDVTPMMDIITILLFGVLINSVLRAEKETGSVREQSEAVLAKAEADRRELQRVGQLADHWKDLAAQRDERLKEAETKQTEITRKLKAENLNMAMAVANLLQVKDADRLTFKSELEKLSSAGAKRLAEIAKDLKLDSDPNRVFRAVRRIEEMQKVFTFVDLHLDQNNFLNVTSQGNALGRIACVGKSPEQIENLIRQALETVNFQQIILFLFSHERDSRILVVEKVETGIQSVLAHYRAGAGGQGKQFRFGRVGFDEPPPGVPQE